MARRWQGTFRMIPDGLWQHPALKDVDLRVWCALMLHAREEASTTTSNASLASAARISVPTLKRSLSRLAATGFVKSEGDTWKRVIHLCPDAVVAVYTLRVANG